MDSTLDFDERTAQQVEAVYRTSDVVAQRRSVRAALELRPGQRVLDIGAGPGFLASEIARDVGPSGEVCGVDVSASMLAIAGRREPGPDSASLRFEHAEARALPFPDMRFDRVVSTQVFEYVDDVPAALAEAHRVLVPGGRLLLLDTDWDSIVWHSSDPDRMRRLLTAWEAHAADPRLPRRLPHLIRAAGFTMLDVSVIPLLNHGFDRDTYSAGLIEIIAGYVADRDGITRDTVDGWARDLIDLGDRSFFSLNRYVFVGVR